MKEIEKQTKECKHQWVPLLGRNKNKLILTLVHACLKCGELKVGKRTIRISRSRLDMGNKPIRNLAVPTASADAVRKEYVDGYATRWVTEY